MKSLCLLILFALAPLPVTAALKVERLRCEYLSDPLGIDTPQPRLSWIMESEQRGRSQTAYQVVVASDLKRLKSGRADLWDSGKVVSGNSAQIGYAGAPLPSGKRCWWAVRVWDEKGHPTAYSPPAVWEMGLLSPGDWHGAWIARTSETAYQPAPLLRRTFTLNGTVRRARIYFCGLGYSELHLNGAKVGDHLLDPGYTRYDKRDLYVTYDVTDRLKPGENALGVMLGTGWYNVHTKAVWYFDRAPWRAAPAMRLELRIEYQDGRTETVASDSSWKTATGPIVYDSIYGGETYDARLEKPGWDTARYKDGDWTAAKVVEGPKGQLTAQQMPPIRLFQTLKPVKLTEPKPGVFLYDMGQNYAGFAQLTVKGPAGAQVVMKFGERLNPDGTLDQSNLSMHQIHTDSPQPFQTDTYILKGVGTEVWEPRFTYHGGQYVEVTGFPGRATLDSLRGRAISSDVTPVGQFSCSNPLLNRIWEATRWSYRSNLQGIPTDCPHREKNGWTGDAHLAAEQGLFNYDSTAVYTKWINDLGDEQRPGGELPGIVPTSGWGYDWGNGPAWDSAFLLIPWYLYIYEGDTRILQDHYEGMRRYVDYLTSRADRGIVSIGLGDWAPFQTETSVEVTSTAYYYRDAQIVALTARSLGKDEDARKYTNLAESIRRAFQIRFFQPATGLYANGSQTALSCALYQGLASPEDRSRITDLLVAAVEKTNGHIDTGILGAKYLLNTLTDNGRTDVAYRIASQKTLPSWGYWLENGATTLWESWRGTDSRNHIMYGDISAWFFKALAGIVPDEASPGFQNFLIKPHPVSDLTSARAEYESIWGRIVSDWKIEQGVFVLKAHIPANTTALIYIPQRSRGATTESGHPADISPGLTSLGTKENCQVYRALSGDYTFASPGF